jgi:hypothetical protein
MEQLMKSVEDTPGIPTHLKAELQEALDNLTKGHRDLEAAKKAAEHMDRLREENRKLFGDQNIAVELVRQMRESR